MTHSSPVATAPVEEVLSSVVVDEGDAGAEAEVSGVELGDC